MEADVTMEGTTETPEISLGAARGRIRLAVAIAAALALTMMAKTLHVQEHLLDLVGWIRDAGWPGLVIFALAFDRPRLG